MNDNAYPLGVPKRAIAEKAAAEKKAKEAAAPKTEFEKYKYTLPPAPVKVAEPVDEYDAWLLAQGPGTTYNLYTAARNEAFEDLGRMAAETAPTQQYPREWKTYNELHARYAVLLEALMDIDSLDIDGPAPTIALRALVQVGRMP